MRAARLLTSLAAAFAVLTLCGPAGAVDINPGTDHAAPLQAPDPRDSFTVAVLGDQTDGEPEGLDVLRQAVTELNLLRPDFVMHIGDMLPGYKRDLDEWEQDIGRVKDLFARLRVPFFPSAGNHDVITGTADAADRRGEELYKKHFGPLYYSFDYRWAHIVVLYSDEALASLPRFSKRQIDWLADDLRRSRAGQVFVFLHKPAWEYPQSNWDAVHQVLKRHPVRAVFAGHFHHYFRARTRDGIRHYVFGPTGGSIYSPEKAGGLTHYSLLRIERDGFTLSLLRPGSVLSDEFVTDADYRNAAAIRFLRYEAVRVLDAVPSPELGPVEATVRLTVTNPLAKPIKVTATGVARGGPWTFDPPEGCTVEVAARATAQMGLRLACPIAAPDALVVPEVVFRFDYVNQEGQTVPLLQRRRVALRRSLTVGPQGGPIVVDGRADEAPWREAPPANIPQWRFSPYESDEPPAKVRMLATDDGLCLLAEVTDRAVAHYWPADATRVLSDALFVAAADPGGGPALEAAPAVVFYPFAEPGDQRAFRAALSPGAPKLLGPADAAQVCAVRTEDGWRCEALVPWQLLGGRPDGGRLKMNFGTWDNDGELFTELRTWAPYGDASLWGTVEVDGRR